MNAINHLLSAARVYRSNRKYLSSDDVAARNYAEMKRDHYLYAAEDVDAAAKQHQMILDGLTSVVNRINDRDAFGRGHHFLSVEAVGFELEALLRRYHDLEEEGTP